MDEDDLEPKHRGRHSNGRWKKGHCPNPLVRRRAKMKEDKEYIRSLQQHSGGMIEFSRAPVEMKIDGKVVHMPRHAAIRHKQFESAMKGSVSAQRESLKADREANETIAKLRKRQNDILQILIGRCSDKRKGGLPKIPLEVELEYLELQSILNDLFPTSYKKPK